MCSSSLLFFPAGPDHFMISAGLLDVRRIVWLHRILIYSGIPYCRILLVTILLACHGCPGLIRAEMMSAMGISKLEARSGDRRWIWVWLSTVSTVLGMPKDTVKWGWRGTARRKFFFCKNYFERKRWDKTFAWWRWECNRNDKLFSSIFLIIGMDSPSLEVFQKKLDDHLSGMS